MGFGSLIDRLGWDFGLVVVLWLWRWLVEFWAGNVCGCSGPMVFVEDFEFFLLFLFSFVEVLDLEFVGDPVIVIVVCGG